MLGQANRISVDAVAPVADGDEPVSSSRIREALEAGDCEHRRAPPDPPVRDRGPGRAWRQEGPRRSAIRPPTSPLDRYQRPRFGVYAVRGRLPGRTDVLDGVANLGIAADVRSARELLEPYFFDFDGDLYGQMRRGRADLLPARRDASFDEPRRPQGADRARRRAGEGACLRNEQEQDRCLSSPPLAAMVLSVDERLLVAPAPKGALVLDRPSRHRPAVRPRRAGGRRLQRPRRSAASGHHVHREHRILDAECDALRRRRPAARRARERRRPGGRSSATTMLDCRTNGTGRVAERPLAYLQVARRRPWLQPPTAAAPSRCAAAASAAC